MSTDPAYLTPDEIQALRLVRARARMDRGDLFPMMRCASRTDPPVVIPWVDAVNLELEIGQ